MIDGATIFGMSGAGLILLAFTFNQIGVWHRDSTWYDAVNLIGAVCLIAYSWLLGSYPFLILNLVWAGVSLRDVVYRKDTIGFFKK